MAPILAVVLAVVLALAGCAAEAPGGYPGDTPRGSGQVVDSLSVTDTDHAALRNLDPDLLAAVQAAARDARDDGIELRITSGWRSKEYQQELLDQAVVRYGSLEAAREFVNTPDKSTHVTGDAVDIGPTDAADWLIRNGAAHGLCQTYANEIWHFELMTEPGGECPAPLSNAAG